MKTLVRSCLMLALACSSLGTVAAVAAEPVALSAARTRILWLRKGSPEVVNFGTLGSTAEADRFIVIFLGTGTAQLTVTDADATGDTINAVGSLNTKFPVTFDVSATSPDSIQQPLLVTTLGILTVDVSYDSIVNGVPANYIYRLKF